jgi:hypothetical protein
MNNDELRQRALDELSSNMLMITQLQFAEARLVVRARQRGATWQQIADTLCVSKTTAWQSFHSLDFSDTGQLLPGVPAEGPTA